MFDLLAKVDCLSLVNVSEWIVKIMKIIGFSYPHM